MMREHTTLLDSLLCKLRNPKDRKDRRKDRDIHYRKDRDEKRSSEKIGTPIIEKIGTPWKGSGKSADTHRLPEQEPNDDIPPLQETEFKPFASAWKTGAILLFWDRVKASTLFEEM